MKNATPTLRLARCAKFNHLGEEILGDGLLYVFIEAGKALRIWQTDDEHFNVFASFPVYPVQIFGKCSRLVQRERCASLWAYSFGIVDGSKYGKDAELTEREVEKIIEHFTHNAQ